MKAPERGADEVWFQTDEAWDFLSHSDGSLMEKIDVRREAQALRFITSVERIESFIARRGPTFRPFTLFGSGDFHHLSAVWMRQFQEPFHLLAFDNHPDWDIRPPRWSCGAWINRALENRLVQSVAIWGCGNFECNFPHRLLGRASAAKSGRLHVHPWQQLGKAYPGWLHPITPENWKVTLLEWVSRHPGQKVYVTIDLDCLSETEAVTNWENGSFTRDDLVWALATVREKMEILGGDLCGAWSPPVYETSFQKCAGWFDHPRLRIPDRPLREQINGKAWNQLWPALTGRGNLEMGSPRI